MTLARLLADDAIGRLAERALLRELDVYPKPGLVSPHDSGSHDDMTAQTLRRSAVALQPHFAALARAGAEEAGMPVLRRLGLVAEAAMLRATSGVNTHRGAIFALGLLCAAIGAEDAAAARLPSGTLGAAVRRRWGPAILHAPVPAGSHGTQALHRHGAGGARTEAASGFPHIYRVGLPALREGRHLAPGDEGAARVQACLALIASVADTNLLHRGGAAGLRFARDGAASFLAAGGVGAPGWRARAVALHRDFVARRLSPGGAADLLAATLLVDEVEA